MGTRERLIPAECGLPSLVGIAALFGSVVGVALGVAGIALARAIGGRTL